MHRRKHDVDVHVDAEACAGVRAPSGISDMGEEWGDYVFEEGQMLEFDLDATEKSDRATRASAITRPGGAALSVLEFDKVSEGGVHRVMDGDHPSTIHLLDYLFEDDEDESADLDESAALDGDRKRDEAATAKTTTKKKKRKHGDGAGAPENSELPKKEEKREEEKADA